MRSLLRRSVIAIATGALTVSVAWAGAGLAPTDQIVEEVGDGLGDATDRAGQSEVSNEGGEDPSSAAAGGSSSARQELRDGELFAGAAKISIAPRPEDYDGTWETDQEKCETLSETWLQQLAETPEEGAHLAAAGSPWPENPNCIYMGGYGIGPMNAISTFDEELGLWVRTVALQDGQGDALSLTIIDGEGYFWDYASKCDDCGIKQITQQLGAELDLDPSSFIIGSTHSHSAPDFIGGWGFVPDWYMQQVADAIRDSVRQAFANQQPARLEIGEERVREYNRERRGTYRSAEEQQVTWLRAVATPNGRLDHPQATTLATVGGYAGHPTTHDGVDDGIGHADWPGYFEHRLEERFGGIGFHFPTGLGNMSFAGNTPHGAELADRIPATGDGLVLEDTDIRTTRRVWRQPATNVPLTALGAAGFFDRQFDPQPAEVRVGGEQDTACQSASPYSVEVAASAAKIGDHLAISAAPGEVFSNLTNTLKEKSGATVTIPIGQAGDALGYMPQSFEMNPVGQQGLGFVEDGYLFINYEDSYAIDRCFGDQTLETTIDLFENLDSD